MLFLTNRIRFQDEPEKETPETPEEETPETPTE